MTPANFSLPNRAIDSPNLYAVLRDSARGHSVWYLAVYGASAASASIGLFIFRESWWGLYLPLAVLACYALCGLLDRARSSVTGEPVSSSDQFARDLLVAANWGLALAGTIAVALFFYRFAAYCLGNWIL